MGESSTGRAQPFLLTWPHWGVAKSCVPLHSRDDERGDAYGELKVRRAVCGASPATKEPWRGHIPSLSVILFLLVGAFYTLYSFCMMVNIVPHVSVQPYSLSEPEMCSLSFVFDTPRCLEPPWFTEIVTSPQSLRPRQYLHCYTLNSESLTGKQRNVCLFERRQGGIGFVCFRTVVFALVPPPTGIHCCLFGHRLRPLTSPNGWLIPVQATVGPVLAFLQCCLPLDLKENSTGFTPLHLWIKLYEAFFNWAADKLHQVIVVKCEKKKGLCTTWSEVSG